MQQVLSLFISPIYFVISFRCTNQHHDELCGYPLQSRAGWRLGLGRLVWERGHSMGGRGGRPTDAHPPAALLGGLAKKLRNTGHGNY